MFRTCLVLAAAVLPLAAQLGCTPSTTGAPLTADALIPGDLVITEYIADAIDTACTDSNGEWVEVKNTSFQPINTEGVRLEDWQGNRTVLPYYVIPPNGYALFGKGPFDSWCEDEAFPHGFYASSFFVNNTGEETLSLLTPSLDVLDLTPVFMDLGTVQGSVAVNFDASDHDGNDDPNNWYYSSTCTPNFPLGTPGSANHTCI